MEYKDKVLPNIVVLKEFDVLEIKTYRYKIK
jgi:hypothetical protein